METIIKQALRRNTTPQIKSTFIGAKTGFEMEKQQMPQQQIQQQQIQTQQFTQKPAGLENKIVGIEKIQTQVQTQDQELERMIKEKQAKICVLGVGGMGCNAINRLATVGIKGATSIALNTDIGHLQTVSADKRILIGAQLTRGLGAGGYPDIGKQAAEETISNIKSEIGEADMLFLVAGMGGGTGTGAAPTIAQAAKARGAIIIGVTTMPFRIEGSRMAKAEEGLAKLRQACDTVIVIENEKLNQIAGNMPLHEAFAVGDEIIVTMIKGITETISTPSLVNLDYADVKAIMKQGGVAMIGIAESSSKSRAKEAITEAMQHPLLDVDYSTATGALIHITGGTDMKLEEITEIGDYVQEKLDPSAQTIWGARIEDDLQGKIRVITIITGVNSPYILGPMKAKNQDIQTKQSMRDKLGIDFC